VTTLPTTHHMKHDRWNHLFLVFIHFLVKLDEISFLGHMQRTLTWTLKAVPQQYWLPFSFCFVFFSFHILLLFFIWHSLTFHIWKCTLDPENSSPKHHHQQWAPSPTLFFLIFPIFYCYFSFGTASLSIFGNVHWTLKTAPPNIITNSEHHPPPFFSWFFPYFIAIFHLAQPQFPYLEIHTGPWKQHPQTSSPTVSTTPLFFSLIFWLFYRYFLFSISRLSIFGNM